MDQLGFEIEEIDVVGGAGHEELHDALRLRGMVQSPADGEFATERAVVAEHRRERGGRREPRAIQPPQAPSGPCA